MSFSNLKAKAAGFFAEAAFIDVLSSSIERWESKSEEFAEFNQKIAELDDGVAALRTIIDQYQLEVDDLKEENGSKSLASMILNGTRKLTFHHRFSFLLIL